MRGKCSRGIWNTRRGGRCGPGFVETPLGVNLGEGFLKGFADGVFLGEEELLGADQSVQAGGGQAEGAQDDHGVVEIGRGLTALNQAAGENAQGGDLFGETFEVVGLKVGEVALAEAAGVEAVLEGVEIAELGASAARGGGGGWHGDYYSTNVLIWEGRNEF